MNGKYTTNTYMRSREGDKIIYIYIYIYLLHSQLFKEFSNIGIAESPADTLTNTQNKKKNIDHVWIV